MGRAFWISTICALITGGIAAIYYYATYDTAIGVITGLATGSVTGGIIFLVIGVLNWGAVRSLKPDAAESVLGVYHECTMEIPGRSEEAFNLCIRSMSGIRGCRVMEINRSAGTIRARTGLNWKTWGDTIFFDIRPSGEGHAMIHFSSRPTFKTTIVDFGKNLQNVIIIGSYLAQYETESREGGAL